MIALARFNNNENGDIGMVLCVFSVLGSRPAAHAMERSEWSIHGFNFAQDLCHGCCASVVWDGNGVSVFIDWGSTCTKSAGEVVSRCMCMCMCTWKLKGERC
ncbi:hypothetical protein T440DRAFT_124585 [Plenodomus tracheiphilus IPT5]|uniref:Uncharacterized protein n=1 Tax=Plenodomus tracheiphilus IPT5 TaxID=1408161 RepID=A0A6A7B5Y5_9PLEO|nr:hypothetical protein T440DRAFT_124585 [Plenodomus tracheiphilus IPT5]